MRLTDALQSIRETQHPRQQSMLPFWLLLLLQLPVHASTVQDLVLGLGQLQAAAGSVNSECGSTSNTCSRLLFETPNLAILIAVLIAVWIDRDDFSAHIPVQFTTNPHHIIPRYARMDLADTSTLILVHCAWPGVCQLCFLGMHIKMDQVQVFST
jgi:hypothetical protein